MSVGESYEQAMCFVAGVEHGAQSYSDICCRETIYGMSEGFVYAIGVGQPYVTHVKIGFTSGHPRKRLAGLQTGCPFLLTLIGFVFGNRAMERELHDVLADWRTIGEWFAYDDYAAKVVAGMLDRPTI